MAANRQHCHRLCVGLVLLLATFCLAPQLLALTTIQAGDMEITSKLMTMQNGIYVARGGLTAVQKGTTMTADRGVYDRNIEVVKAFDRVVVKQPDSTLHCDYLEAYVKEDRMLAQGNPRLERIVVRQSKDDQSGELRNRKTRVILTCNEVEGFNKENRFLAKGNVHVIEVAYRQGETEEEAKAAEKDPLSDLTCESLEIFSAEDKAIARNKVIILTKTLRATGDKAIYLDRENRLIIVGHAHAWQTSKETPDAQEQVSEIYAKKIIYYPNEDRSIAVGEVHATVYPKGSSGRDDKDSKKKKKKKGEGEEGADADGPPGARGAKGGAEGEGAAESGDGTGSPAEGQDLNEESDATTPTTDRFRPPPSAGASSDDRPGNRGSTTPDDLPPGDYTPIGGESGPVNVPANPEDTL